MFSPCRGLLLLVFTTALGAAEQSALEIPTGSGAKLNDQAAFLARLLDKGGAVYFRLPADALPSRNAKGQWRPEPLQEALRSQTALAFRGDLAAAAEGLDISTGDLGGVDEGRWLFAAGLPKIVIVEDSSTVSPLSKELAAWRWPVALKTFAQVEANPRGILAVDKADMVFFSSPGWWADFANPPGGPSRMPKKVAEALRDFVRQGGSAVFIDIAQWDLEKAWPKTLNLVPLGPYQVNKLKLEGSVSGAVSLAPVGVATDKLRSEGAFNLLGSDAFLFPDGKERPIHAAFAMPDPGGGQGWVAGLALHVFEQDESLAARVRRLFLNLLLLSGTRRMSTQGEPKAPTPSRATFTRTPRRSPTPSPSASPPPTEGPTPTIPPTAVATLPPTPEPTAEPTPVPSPVPTRRVTKASPPPLPPTPRSTVTRSLPPPTLAPRRSWPTATVVVVPTLSLPRPRPTPIPTRAPRVWPTRVPTQVRLPTPVPPTAVPPTPRPTAVLERSIKTTLGCLDSAPEPFGEGGVFLSFCLARQAKAQVRVFDAQGRPLWRSSVAELGAGTHKVFYEGRANGRFLAPGRYLWEVHVRLENGHSESRQGAMTRRRESRRN